MTKAFLLFMLLGMMVCERFSDMGMSNILREKSQAQVEMIDQCCLSKRINTSNGLKGKMIKALKGST
jgi:hypothetical protein